LKLIEIPIYHIREFKRRLRIIMRFRGKIPISIHPAFWIIAAVIGWLYSQSFGGTVVWVAIIFISVLIHEMGHALMALVFKQKPQISLVAMGGATTFEGKNLKFWQQFLITLNGPIFGFLLFFLAWGLIASDIFQQPNILAFLTYVKIINLFWTCVNLLPILPLDGGQLVRIAFEAWLGVKGFKISLFIGMLTALGFSLTFFIMQYFLIGALFFLFAFQSFDMFRRSKNLSASDRDLNNANLFQQGERSFEMGRLEEAKNIFSEVRQKTKKGMLFVGATYYLALLLAKEDKRKEAYDLLLPIKDQVPEEGIFLLHDLAFEAKNYPLVAKLASDCYQKRPTQEIALRNAKAFASMSEAKPAGGWLKTAMQEGHLNLAEILKEEEFAKVKDLDEFKSFFEK